MTITHSHRRAGLAALLATGVLLLGACGGDDDDASDDTSEEEASGDDAATADDATDSTGDTPSPTPSVNADAPAADSDFCQAAIAAMTASVDSNGADDATREAAENLEAPDDIAEAWENVLATYREVSELDYTDPEAAAQAQTAYEGIADDQAAVIAYLQEDCGIGLPGPTDGSVPSPPTTGA